MLSPSFSTICEISSTLERIFEAKTNGSPSYSCAKISQWNGCAIVIRWNHWFPSSRAVVMCSFPTRHRSYCVISEYIKMIQAMRSYLAKSSICDIYPQYWSTRQSKYIDSYVIKLQIRTILSRAQEIKLLTEWNDILTSFPWSCLLEIASPWDKFPYLSKQYQSCFDKYRNVVCMSQSDVKTTVISAKSKTSRYRGLNYKTPSNVKLTTECLFSLSKMILCEGDANARKS